MTQAIQTVGKQALTLAAQMGVSDEYVELVKKTVAVGASDTELMLFLDICDKTKLNPMNKEIYFWKHGGKVVIHTGIDGHRKSADRTGKYVPGKDIEYEWPKEGDECCGLAGKPHKPHPIAATAYVKKFAGGEWHEVSFRALWSTFYKDTPQWKGQYGHHQLGISAERHALKKAFPQLGAIENTESLEMNGDSAPVETPEQKQRRGELSQALLRIGQTILSADQLKSLEAQIPVISLETLEERYTAADAKLRELTIEKAESVLGSDAGQFLTTQFPKGIDQATCLQVIDAFNRVDAWEPPAQIEDAQEADEVIEPDPEIDDEFEQKAVEAELRDAINHKLDELSGGEEAARKKILNGRDLDQMDLDMLSEFNVVLDEGEGA